MTNILANTAVESERRRVPRVETEYVGGVVAALDTVIILASTQIACFGYGVATGDVSRGSLHYLGIGFIFIVLFVSSARLRGAYDRDNFMNLGRKIRILVSVHGSVTAVLAFTAFALKIGSAFSRGGVLTFLAVSLIAIVANHLWWDRKVKESPRTDEGIIAPRRVLLIGNEEAMIGADTIDRLRSNGFETVRTMLLPGRSASKSAMRKFFQSLSALAKQQGASEVLFVSRWRHIPYMVRVVEEFRVFPLPIRLVVDPSASVIIRRPVQQIGELVTLQMRRSPMTWVEIAVKRSIDILVSGTALLIFFPSMLLVTLVIKLDSCGPALFKQARLGFNGVPFKILKFRSMTVLEDGHRVVQASRGDARVTRVGRLIRKMSIDELPQLWNILRGDMSLVGPRPHAMAHDSHYEKHLSDYTFRQHVKPGLTGWAQVNGSRGETPTLDSMARRVSLDMWYINNRSISLDIKIIAKTALQLVANRHVY